MASWLKQRWTCVDLEIPLPVSCFCIEVFNRPLCLGCSYDIRVHPRAEQEQVGDSQSAEEAIDDAGIYSVLSQNICLCKQVFGSDSQCFCGYGQAAQTESSRQPVTTRMQTAQQETAPVTRTTKRRPTTNPANGSDKQKHPIEPEAKGRKPRRVPEKMFDMSLTISIPGTDIKGETFDVLVNFLEERAEMGVLVLERGDSHLQLHIQGLLRISTSSTRALKTEIRDRIGWQEAGPLGGSICVKSLKYKGLHTVIGIIGYCLKDEGEEHFRFHSKNVSEAQKEEGKRVHAIYGASEYKNRLELTPVNVLGRALQFRRYRVKNPVTITCIRCVREMFYSGHYMPGFRWLTSAKVSPLRAERIWRACTNPQSVEVADCRNILFGIDTPARYFEPETAIKTEFDTDADLDDEMHENELPADDDDTDINVVNLERQEESGVDLERVQEALLSAGFAVDRNGKGKMHEKHDNETLPEYIRLWR
ncbi:hypothetical protein R1sor_005057 [Riccia sorocarpa]|uniref:Replitron HUH endonuclease domain-containing protein n=1 Tax=Riccia sorocarpa TaxID=122646 RepID=A0ABD3HMQ5_9MARC